VTSLWLDTAHRPDAGAYEPGSAWDTVVVGAGITGLVTAVLLARSGQRVLVIEARRAGEVTTGNTTGKVSLLQGSVLSSVVRDHGRRVGAAYVAGNRAGQDWVLDYCTRHQVPLDRRDAWSYAHTRLGGRQARHEYETARRLDLPVTWSDSDELPYPTHGAVRLADQAQIDPLPLLAALAAELASLGGLLVEGLRVADVRPRRSGVSVTTSLGPVTADRAVLASGVPFLDRGLYFAKVQAQRSYAAAFRVPGPVPQGMYLSVDTPTRSLRTAAHAGEKLLVVGGNGHPVGRPRRTPRELVEDLEQWTRRHFPGAERTHVWSAQDYRSANAVPFVGPLPRGGGRIHLATGFGKWGMTNGPMAALMIAGDILGDRQSWARTLQRRVTRPAGLLNGLRFNAEVGLSGVGGWVGAQARQGVDADEVPPEGEGVVGADGGRPVAVSTVGGVTCAVSAVCSHLGGVVAWNDQERSWDCPLHGSRFGPDGSVLEGPATRPLPVRGAAAPDS
jgi:glycine/D-amino acid oxidase-like deaminating enzyme/nitrite reductase/ring-hydroxylating ferredoxin subunit